MEDEVSIVPVKLQRLPERTPVKMSIVIPPDLHRRLQAYADAYTQAYGNQEPLSELIPAILVAFLDSDRAFSGRRQPSLD